MLLFGSAKTAADAPYASAPSFSALGEALPPAAIIVSQADDGWSIHFGVLRRAAQDVSKIT